MSTSGSLHIPFLCLECPSLWVLPNQLPWSLQFPAQMSSTSGLFPTGLPCSHLGPYCTAPTLFRKHLSSRQKHLPCTLCLVSALTVCPITTSTTCEKSAWLIAGAQGVFVEQVNEMACVHSGLEGLTPQECRCQSWLWKMQPSPKKTKIRDRPKMIPNFWRAEKASVL